MSPRLVLLRSQTDERLVGLARAGNERAFVAIVERYRPELQALARRLCPDGRSEDVLQQAFLSAFVALSAGSEVRHLRGWLYQIVRNAARRPPAPHCVPLDRAAASVNSAEDVVQQRALAMTTLSELAQLPDRQREAMIGTALDGRPRAEIASSMGLSEGAVRQLVHRARTALRSAVTAVTPWPVAKWIAAVRPDVPGTAELASGAGAASSGGLAIKLGALLASGTLLTGAAVDLRGAPGHHDGSRAATSAQARPHARHARAVIVASLAPPVSVDPVSERSPAVEAVTSPRRLVAPARGGARPDSSRRDGREAGSGRDGGPGDGQSAGRHDDTGTRSGGGDSRRDGGASRRDGGTDGSDARSGSGDSGSGSLMAAGSDRGGDAQIASDSQRLDSTKVDGTGSSQSSGSGDGSGSGFATGSGSGPAVGGSSSSSGD